MSDKELCFLGLGLAAIMLLYIIALELAELAAKPAIIMRLPDAAELGADE